MRREDHTRVSPWQTFKRLCLLLAPAPTRVSPDLSGWDWETLVYQASVHLVTPALAGPLNQVAIVPAEVRQYFSAFHDLNERRNKTVFAAVSEMLAGLREIGVEAIAFRKNPVIAGSLAGRGWPRITLICGGTCGPASGSSCITLCLPRSSTKSCLPMTYLMVPRGSSGTVRAFSFYRPRIDWFTISRTNSFTIQDIREALSN